MARRGVLPVRPAAAPAIVIPDVIPGIAFATLSLVRSETSTEYIQSNFGFLLVLAGGNELWTTASLNVTLPSHRLRMTDHFHENTLKFFEEAVETLHTQREAGNRVLIVDALGVSRPPGVVIGYLLKYSDKTMKECVDEIVAAYPATRLSHDMTHLLMHAEVKWRGTNLRNDEIATYAPHLFAPLPSPEAWSVRLSEEAREAMKVGLFKHRRMDWQDATFIIPGVWIGNVEAARSVHWLKLHKITTIVNCAAEVEAPTPAFLAAAEVTATEDLRIVESKDFAAVPVLKRGAAFVRENVAGGRNVLIHCLMGINRSVSTALTFLMMEHKIPLLDALTFIRERRTIANPNPEMWPNLVKLELEFLGCNSVTLEDVERLY